MTQAVHLAAVFLDGKELCMSEGERTQEHVLGEEPSELTLTWQERCPTVGQAVKITTGARRQYIIITVGLARSKLDSINRGH